LYRVLGEVIKVGDARQDTFTLLDGIHHGMLERRASQEIQVDDTCVHRCAGHLPNREKVAVKVDRAFLVIVCVVVVRVDLFRNRTWIHLR
jgi:hypothetical protein